VDYVAPLDKMTTEEKLRLMEALWVDLTRNEAEFSSPSWHADVLKTREERISSGQEEFRDWQTAKGELRNRLL
jgi:hypothetical protein